MKQNSEKFPWLYLLLMSSITFIVILSELLPSGVLPEMSEGLNVSYSSIGLLLSVHAIASALGTIPLITMTMQINRKRLLIAILIIFGVSNLVITFSSNYFLTALSRLTLGIANVVLWPMISAYAMGLVPSNMEGKAIAVVMAGSTLGLGIGLPIMTSIGTELGWRIEFGVLTAIIFIIAILTYYILPSIEGEKKSATNSPFYIIKNKSVVICLGVTFLTIMAHYGLYTYISPLVDDFNFIGGIKLASILFGIGTIVSVLIATRSIDIHIGRLLVFMLCSRIITMVLFLLFKGMFIVSQFAFFLWGISFGSLVSIFQAAVTKQVTTGKDVATSLQSSVFNFGVLFGSALGGGILDLSSVYNIIFVSLILLIGSTIISIFSKRTYFSN